jgi:hypothetical protein
MLQELQRSDDLLSCLAALQQVTELVASHEHLPGQLREHLVPAVLQMLRPEQDTAVITAALLAGARLVAGSARQHTHSFVQHVDALLQVCSSPFGCGYFVCQWSDDS